jgi:ubiquinone/menaquinone biosynthesis C-methylase UbiE
MTHTLDARLPQSEILKLYNRLARFYDVWGVLAESRARRKALDLAGIRNGEAVLEVAVGTGLTFRPMVGRNADGINIGVDLSPGMLQKAGTRLADLPPGRFELRLGDARNLDLADRSFDLLMNNYMFDLIPFDQMDAILDEFKRVLKPGGRLVMINMTRPQTWCAGFYDWLYALSPGLMGGCRGVEMTDRLEARGFRVEKRIYLQQLCFPSEVVRAVRGG